MDQRYFLRFESGERKGETIPIPASGMTVGRRPGHSLQITDASVSGNHAELRVEAGRVRLKDLGSTNGTRVEGQRVQDQLLEAGQRVQFGTVELFFGMEDSTEAEIELELEPAAVPKPAPRAAPAPAPAAAAPRPVATKEPALSEAPSELGRVSAEQLARAKRVSRPGILVLVLAAIGGGVWYWLQGTQGAGPARTRAVEPVLGNLLAEEYSFEGERDSWSGVENAPQAFLRSSAAAASGDYGVGTDLAAGEWARTRSKSLPVAADKELLARAQLRARGGAHVRLGLEFSQGLADERARAADVLVFGRVVDASSSSYTTVELASAVPPGYDRVRVVVDARAAQSAGSAAGDDVSLVLRGQAAKAAAELGESRLLLLGEPAQVGLLARGGSLTLSAIECFDSAGQALAFEASTQNARMQLKASGNAAIARMSLRVDGELAGRGLATLGAEKTGAQSGFRSHGAVDFERSSVGTVLIGSGRDLIALRGSQAATVRGVRETYGLGLVLEFPAGCQEVSLQTDFREERKSAQDLAANARAAEKKNELGECMRQWSALLDNYPFEEPLVREAEESNARLTQAGLAELRLVAQEIERARFFRLPELLEQCRAQAQAVGARFAGSAVERAASELAAGLETDLSGARAAWKAKEVERLRAMLTALEASGSKGLAEQLRAAIAAQEEKH